MGFSARFYSGHIPISPFIRTWKAIQLARGVLGLRVRSQLRGKNYRSPTSKVLAKANDKTEAVTRPSQYHLVPQSGGLSFSKPEYETHQEAEAVLIVHEIHWVTVAC